MQRYFYCQNGQKCWNLKFSQAKEEEGSVFIPDSQRGRGISKKITSINSEKSEGLASRKDLFGHEIYKWNLHISVEGTYM